MVCCIQYLLVVRTGNQVLIWAGTVTWNKYILPIYNVYMTICSAITEAWWEDTRTPIKSEDQSDNIHVVSQKTNSNKTTCIWLPVVLQSRAPPPNIHLPPTPTPTHPPGPGSGLNPPPPQPDTHPPPRRVKLCRVGCGCWQKTTTQYKSIRDLNVEIIQ